jgi:hypothetical protein
MNAGIDTKESSMNTKEVIDRIFKDPATQYELTEFENLGKAIHDILAIYLKTAATGRDAGKTKYYLKSFIPFSSGNEEVQVYVEDGKANPEEIVRQLWVYKLINQYGYKMDEIDLEASVQFGFVLPAYDEQTINVSAREKAESFASINSKLGVVQKGALTEAIRAGYAKRAGSPTPYPDFQDILEIAAAAYEEDGKKDDSLIEVLRDLSDFDLFWKHGSDRTAH